MRVKAAQAAVDQDGGSSLAVKAQENVSISMRGLLLLAF
jgi:hypothetical protein